MHVQLARVRWRRYDQRVLRTQLGTVAVRTSASGSTGVDSPESVRVEILGNWPPDAGSMVQVSGWAGQLSAAVSGREPEAFPAREGRR